MSRTEQASAKDATLEVHSFGDSAWRILWIADPLAVWHVCDDPRTISDATITVSDLQPGSFSVEVWDIASGQHIAMLQGRTQDGRIAFPLPQFQRDLACKVKLIDANQ